MGERQDELVAILSYFLVGILWYLLDEKVRSDFSKWHVSHAITLDLLLIVLTGAWSVLGVVMGFVPSIGWMLGTLNCCVGVVLFLGFGVVDLYLLYQAFTGQTTLVPLISELAQKVADILP